MSQTEIAAELCTFKSNVSIIEGQAKTNIEPNTDIYEILGIIGRGK